MRNKFTKKLALAFGALLFITGINNTKAQVGAALNFSTTTNLHVVLPTAISTNSLVGGNKVTAEAWVRPTAFTTGNGCIVGNFASPSNQLSFLLRRSGSLYQFFIGPGNVAAYTAVQTAVGTCSLNVWQHVAGVYDGTVASIYINGAFSASATIANTVFATNTNSITVGWEGAGGGAGEQFEGDMDELRIWNTSRTQCQICNFMNCEIPTNATNLIANYHFNQGIAAGNNGTVTTLTDATSNAFNGTLNNFAPLTGSFKNWVAPGGVVSNFTTTGTTIVNPSNNITTCLNNTVSFNAIYPGITYTWSGGISNGVAFTATATTSYTAVGTVTAAPGCTFTAVGNVTTTNCPGEALRFDGVNDNVALTQPFTSDFTIEYWMKTTQLAPGGAQWFNGVGIVDGEVGGVTNDCGTALVSNKIGFGIGNPDISIFSTSTVNNGNWVHVAATWKQSTGAMKLYINGVLEAQNTSATAARTATTALKLGSYNYGTGFFNGWLDEVRIWNVERTQCEINTFKNCEIPSNATGLVVNYHLNQGTAFGNNSTVTIASDATSSANNGTLTNFGLNAGNVVSNWIAPGAVAPGFTTTLAPPSITVSANPSLSTCQNNTIALTASGASTYTWSGGVSNAVAFTASATTNYTVIATNAITTCTNSSVASVTANNCPGAALAVDGTNDYVNLGSVISTSLNTGNKITFEAWVYPTTLAGVGMIGGTWATAGGASKFWVRRNAASFDFRVDGASGNGYVTGGTATLNVWQHIAATWDGANLKLYVNGNSVGTAAYASANFINSAAQTWLGWNSFNEGFAGKIDEVRIWNTNRTQCEINTFMNCEIPANSTSLIANYHFNQGQAFSANTTNTTLTDATSSAITGTLTNMALTAGNLTSNWVTPGGVISGYTTALAAPGFTNTSLAICPGGSVTLGSTGATSFTWNPAVTDNVAFTPTASISYSYAGTNSVTTCSGTGVANVTVNPNPTVTAVTSETNVICVGQSATLTAGGATSYTWNTTATTSVIVISPTINTTYTVTGTNANGCSSTATVTQNVSPCTGLTNQFNQVVLEIYPNPSLGMFTLKTASDASIKVFDVLGNLILSSSIIPGEYKLDLSEQSKGIYIVKYTSQGQVKSYRLIKE